MADRGAQSVTQIVEPFVVEGDDALAVLGARLDAQSYEDLEAQYPGIAEAVVAAVRAGHGPEAIRRYVRRQGVAVERWGNDLHDVYLEVCRAMLIDKAALAGYDVDRFAGYYCGHLKAMTHYLAILRGGGPGRA